MKSFMKRMVKEDGVALVMVLVVMVIFFALVSVLLFLNYTDRVVAVNEADYLKSLGHAEAGLAWAQRRIQDAGGTGLNDLLNGPNNTSAADDNLLGLRDLSLIATSEFTLANENTASAIVQRNFGDGNRIYEVIRFPVQTNTRANVYVRIDDNFDDDPDDPSNNDPLIDTDARINSTAIAEYPVFIDGAGREMPNNVDERGRAVRRLAAEFGGQGLMPAIVTDGSLDISGNMEVCGACGSVHANDDISIGGGPEVCEDATATDTFSNNSGTIHGSSGGGYPDIQVPIINPYDNVFVPSKDIFTQLGCGVATAGDPGNSKYFALVIDNGKGKVFKAYWDFVNNDKWTWKLIDDLNDGTDVVLDDCGRAPGDAGYGGSLVTDGLVDEFYGFKASDTENLQNCANCGSAGDDATLCTPGNNDFGVNGYFETGTLNLIGAIGGSSVPALPGSFTPDTQPDFDPERWLQSKWDYGGSTIYSPLYGAVVWAYGQIMISGNPGKSGSIDYCDSVGCSTTLPGGLWKVSLIAYSDIQLSGQANLGPAAPPSYSFQLVAGRDIMINGNPQEDSVACAGSPVCSTSSPAGIADMAGVYAAHEQIQLEGNPNIFGFLVAEDALDCSTTVDAQGNGISTINGDPNIFYDCNNPPNPWNALDLEVLTWQELD